MISVIFFIIEHKTYLFETLFETFSISFSSHFYFSFLSFPVLLNTNTLVFSVFKVKLFSLNNLLNISIISISASLFFATKTISSAYVIDYILSFSFTPISLFSIHFSKSATYILNSSGYAAHDTSQPYSFLCLELAGHTFFCSYPHHRLFICILHSRN